MRRQFVNENRGRLGSFKIRKHGLADVADQVDVQAGFFQRLLNERGGGALAFGARNADGLSGTIVEENLGLRGDLFQA